MFHVAPKYQNENLKKKNEGTEDEKKGRKIYTCTCTHIFICISIYM